MPKSYFHLLLFYFLFYFELNLERRIQSYWLLLKQCNICVSYYPQLIPVEYNLWQHKRASKDLNRRQKAASGLQILWSLHASLHKSSILSKPIKSGLVLQPERSGIVQICPLKIYMCVEEAFAQECFASQGLIGQWTSYSIVLNFTHRYLHQRF